MAAPPEDESLARFGDAVEEREPYDTGLRVQTLERMLTENALKQAHLLYSLLRRVFESPKLDLGQDHRQIVAMLAEIKTAIDALPRAFSQVMLEALEAHRQFERGHLQELMRTVFRNYAENLRTQSEGSTSVILTRLDAIQRSLDEQIE